MMNLDYISGFFDADGSITLAHGRKNEFRSIKIDFSNTKKSTLIEIKDYLEQNYNIKLYLSTKSSKNENWAESYAVSASYNDAYKLCKLLDSHHPIKKHRINTVLKYYKDVTKRNGKYNNKELNRKLAFERLFFCTIFQ